MNCVIPKRTLSILVPVVPPDSPDADPNLSVLIRELASRALAAVRDAEADVIPFDHAGRIAAVDAVAGCDGVLLLGGGDVDPGEYGESKRHAELYNVNRVADRGEIDIVRTATALRRPILAICRGMHVVNVAHGGTLLQHMPATAVRHRGPRGRAMIDHEVVLEERSLIADVLNEPALTVRSGHHQSVDRLGPGLRIGARAHDGTIEAVEDADRAILAVQWHPEDNLASAQDRTALFAWLIDATRRRRQDPAPIAAHGDQVTARQ